MGYTRNQHMLSQWFLRNFRSDDTAQSPKEKQRVWAHVVVPAAESKNDIKDIPLPISSVAVCKDCFRLTDGDTGEVFDIEHELSDYEQDMALLVRDLVQNHNFPRLANCDTDDFPVEKLASFAIFQMLLNLNNPQSRFPGKNELFQTFINPVKNNIQHIISETISLPEVMPELATLSIYQKLIRIARSSSGDDEKAKAMFILFSLLALQGKITMIDAMARLRGEVFSGIHRVDIFHTGHHFDSTEPRPVFTVSPNVFCKMTEERVLYLPLAHNLALEFYQYPEHGFFTPLEINVFSPAPQKLLTKDMSRINIYKCSYDYIDQVMSTIDMYNVGFSNIIYSSWQLSDVENYLRLQNEHHDTYYLPEHPVCWTVSREKG
ncbi:DUF4238 domain-containing protein (plasmid) [Enterobacter cloacae subsp. cloacae]|jgi:hypothetical protein|uniref:DUF4238 domain-containing protein n=1 Tax=Klebsiella michiganensis TaxID=1134687 RepID=A0AB35Q3T2_9ENTR|nr:MULTISPECIES: DUF4238 domain-containing protein [Enterobacteriaceae]EDV1051852.1 DUF4238 domain-containing protein [Salmonella enterica subsp. enterica]MDU1355522.1 DUF4238 domain-containing protein [Citrobacter freundii]AIA45278.1 hypothetical protein KPNIH27_29250 [Klebsiella pneumoniae subsp. pneumoniae KPNIH27]AVE81453.1 DUF4238 domain-containing protein [Klebsiella oxytoca]ELS4497004.1 DUF4238 domain-containing protein [Klebsiella michiganensis]